MIEAWRDGRIDDARTLGARVQRLADVVFAAPVANYRARLKESLAMLGVIGRADVRPPLQPVSDDERRLLAQTLEEVGLLEEVQHEHHGGSPGAGIVSERADVLIVGAGAAGGVVAARLARAGINVVCLEQGRWHDLDETPAPQADSTASRASSGRGAPTTTGCPRTTGRRFRLRHRDADVQRGRRQHGVVRGGLAAAAAVGLPYPGA